MLYLENAKEYKKKVIELACISNKVLENKANAQISICICTHQEHADWKMKLDISTVYNNVDKH